MSDQHVPDWLAGAAEEFNGSGGRNDGARVAGSLFHGLRVLREAFYLRIHQDVERMIGKDSLLMPVSEMQALRRTTEEVEAFQVAESAAAARQSGYLGERADWYLPWLVRLRLGEQPAGSQVLQRCLEYASRPDDQRRLGFTDALVRILPESRKAPLVLFRLYPLALRIVTAGAFEDRDTAAALRNQQSAVLPAILACRVCHGRILPSDEPCARCGNPLWKYEWLTVID
jgi:hypothetical protein